MRDALSIMDQAIASAPLVEGHPALEVMQVRELMGSVSNVVYEQVLEAVNANNSADVLAVIGRLLDAGNGAPQLARQFVRYLRNCVVAKITGLAADAEATGIAADLLQISPEERQRAARSAALFTEEELSRFLSIMLRTFDDLGYRQEQRFHLELGLLKLVHVQRLVPVEELLSQLGAKPANPPLTKTTSASAPRPSAVEPATSAGSAAKTSSFSPVAATSRPSATATSGSMALATAPMPVSAQPGPQLVVTPAAPIHAEPIHATEIVAEPIPAASSDDLTSLQAAMVAALAAVKGQQSASEQIEESTFNLNGDALEIQTNLSEKMLPVGINAEAEKVLNATLRAQAGSSLGTVKRLRLLPGAPAATAAPKRARTAASGTAAELAQKHPVVQQAIELFSAEISNIIDLRDKD
jgi:DNA polymerase-3 subunit gamma/tau